MKYLIIGNGPAGTTAAGKLRSLDKHADIKIVSKESYSYYAKPLLPKIVSNEKDITAITIYPNSWYQKNRIELLINTEVIKIDPDNKQVITPNAILNYDKLLLATGATPRIPDFVKNTDIHTLRTIKDALNLQKSLHRQKQLTIIGGGLLGLEIAGEVCSQKTKVTLIEHSQYLLSRCLTTEQSIRLKSKMEAKGIDFVMGNSVTNIVKNQDRLIISLAEAKSLEAKNILYSIGVNANKDLSKQAGIKTNKGIVVNNFLQTNIQDIYAAGDCIEFQDNCWGFVKTAIQQGKTAAANMFQDSSTKYLLPDITPILKIPEIDLTTL